MICLRNYIAIMKPSQPTQENDYIAIAALVPDDQMLPHGCTTTSLAWGATDCEL